MFKENNAGVTLAKGFKASGIKAGVKKKAAKMIWRLSIQKRKQRLQERLQQI